MSLSLINEFDLNIDSYKLLPNKHCKKVITILDFPPNILTTIFENIDTTKDYKNIRLSCRAFYFICENMIVFNDCGKKIKEVFIANSNIYKIEKYSTLFFYINNKETHFKKKISLIKNWKKHGVEIELDSKGTVIKRIPYKFGRKNGFEDEYLYNRIVKRTGFINNLKHGSKIIYLNNYSVRIELEYLVNILTKYKKFIKNKPVIDANFNGTVLNGKTIIYYIFDPQDIQFNNIKNILDFHESELHGEIIINEFDRILRLNYVYGQLCGTQSVFNIDNKLRFIGAYLDGKLNGKYTLFNNYKQIEEGFICKGVFDKYISIVNPTELSKITYPLIRGMLYGEYIERINFMEIRLTYKYGIFDGTFHMTDITHGETVKLIIYNANNFYYSKMKFGIEYIVFKKEFKKYNLTIYDIHDDIKNTKRISIDLDSFI
jgi:hypothetical protein